jgi:NADPH2:quinone reductase
MGMCVSYGDTSGNCPPIDINHLLLNSLYLTKPTLALYKANRIELVLAANEVFKAIEKGILRPNITTFKFSELAKVHEKMENRETTGSIVLTF